MGLRLCSSGNLILYSLDTLKFSPLASPPSSNISPPLYSLVLYESLPLGLEESDTMLNCWIFFQPWCATQGIPLRDSPISWAFDGAVKTPALHPTLEDLASLSGSGCCLQLPAEASPGSDGRCDGLSVTYLVDMDQVPGFHLESEPADGVFTAHLPQPLR